MTKKQKRLRGEEEVLYYLYEKYLRSKTEFKRSKKLYNQASEQFKASCHTILMSKMNHEIKDEVCNVLLAVEFDEPDYHG